MGDISKGVADTLQPAKKIYKKKLSPADIPYEDTGSVHLLKSVGAPVMRIQDVYPGSRFFPILDPASRGRKKQRIPDP
jgi:hypothetical protein